MNLIEDLKWRGLVKDCTNIEELTKRLEDNLTCYCGFDPTADSLHIGHLQQIILLKRYQKYGHRPIALCGGATGMIGDPRQTSERKLITIEEVRYNVECIKKQISKFIDFNEDKALLLNNYDWLGSLNLLDFLRDYGKHFNVSYMIAKDTIASRLSSGISFTEFTYTILQAADWLYLYRNYNCQLQIGGSDQWGNLVSGVDLIRKVEQNSNLFGITSPLITKSDGSKFGKSEGKNIWLDPDKTSAYEFYQYFVNVSDEDVIRLLKRLSFKTKQEIEELEKSLIDNAHLRLPQKALACELTELVHGENGLKEALKITETLFSGDINDLSVNELKIGLKDAKRYKLATDTLLVDALVMGEFIKSKREARDLIKSNAISINGNKINDLDYVITKENSYDNEFTIVKRGKKNWYIFEF